MKLEPCPFCLQRDQKIEQIEVGNTKDVFSFAKTLFEVHCNGCHGRGPWADTQFLAVALWNACLLRDNDIPNIPSGPTYTPPPQHGPSTGHKYDPTIPTAGTLGNIRETLATIAQKTGTKDGSR